MVLQFSEEVLLDAVRLLSIEEYASLIRDFEVPPASLELTPADPNKRVVPDNGVDLPRPLHRQRAEGLAGPDPAQRDVELLHAPRLELALRQRFLLHTHLDQVALLV